jgi:tetratricopeptide (TPR) repeat protein
MRIPALMLSLCFIGATGLVLSTPADTQRRGQQQAQAKEPMFPNATRPDPQIRANQRLSKQVMSLYDLSQEDGKEAQAIAAGEALLEARGAGAYERALAYRIMAFTEVNRDDYDAAIEYLRLAVEENGLSNDEHYQSMFQMGQMQFQEEKYADAAVTFERFIAEIVTPKQEHVALLGNAYYRMDRFEDAVVQLRRAMGMSDTIDSTIGQLLMASLFELERTAEAAEIAQKLLDADPDNAGLIRNLSAIYVNADMIDKAIEVLASGLERGLTAEERDYRQLSQMYRFNEQDAKAIALMNDGLAKGILQPSLEIYRALGEANYFSENIEAAAEAFAKADELSTDGEMALNLARANAELERWPQTKAAAQRAISKGVRRPGDAWVILGAAEFGLNNQSAAIAAYREAAKHPETKAMAEAYLRQVSGR